MKKIVCIIVLLMSVFLVAQRGKTQEKKIVDTPATKSNIEVNKSLQIMMNQYRNKEMITIKESDILEGKPELVLELLKPYKKDISPRVKWRAYTLSWQIAVSHSDSKLRREVVSGLVEALRDENSLVNQSAGKYLLAFDSRDFTDETKLSIHDILVTGQYKRGIIRIIGVANMVEEMEKLKEFLIDETKYDSIGKWYGTVGWAARLARARMGNKADIRHVIKLVESEPNEVLRIAILLSDLAYTRQPEAIEVLKKYLESNEATPSFPPDVRSMPYSQYAMDLLAEVIRNFPVKRRDVGGYSKADIEQARKWMKKKSNWINSIRR